MLQAQHGPQPLGGPYLVGDLLEQAFGISGGLPSRIPRNLLGPDPFLFGPVPPARFLQHQLVFVLGLLSVYDRNTMDEDVSRAPPPSAFIHSGKSQDYPYLFGSNGMTTFHAMSPT